MDDDTKVTDNPQDDANDGGTQSGGKTFTQEQLDAILAERLARAKSGAQAELLKELGFEKPGELKAAVDKLRDTERANQTETERLRADNETLKQRMADAEASRKNALIRAAVTAAASKAGLADVEDAMRLGALESVTLEGDKVSGAEDVVAALVASKPYLVAGEGKRPAPSPTNPSSPSRLTIDAIKRMSVEEIRQNQDAVDAALANQS